MTDRDEAIKAGNEAFINDQSAALAATAAMGWSDEDIPHLKAWLASMLKNGTPIFLHPSQAKAAVAAGFVEGVHFYEQKAIP